MAVVDEMFQAQKDTLRLLKRHLLRAANRMKMFAYQRIYECVFQVGYWIYIKLHPFQHHSVRLALQTKLNSKYYGPFLVLEKVGIVAYRLDLLAGSLVHPTFHVSLLKVMGAATMLFLSKTILERKLAKRHNRVVVRFLVK